MLVAGAVLGGFEATELLAAVARCDEDMTGRALSRGVDAGLLTTRAGTIGFRHDIIREAVLDIAMPHVVRQMHRAAAAALPAGTADGRRAAHLAAAGEHDQAAGYFAAAAIEELGAHALLGAERLAGQAVKQARSGPTRTMNTTSSGAATVSQRLLPWRCQTRFRL